MKLKDKAWVYIALLTLVTALIWLGVSVKSTFNKSTVPQGIEQLVEKIDPKIDQSVFEDLRRRAAI